MKITNYIADNIPEQEILNWKGNNILIVADTGLGKTTFVGTKLVDYTNSVNKKILYLCNRIALKNQVIKQFANIGIDIQTYQHFEKNLNFIEEYLTDNYILVLDETHYFGTDAVFNPKMQLLYEKLIFSNNEKLFMTATPECLYLPPTYFQYKYEFRRNLNDYIEKCYYYNTDNAIMDLINHIPENEKVLYICTNKDIICHYADILKNKASVLMANSETNKFLYEKYHCKDTFNEIVNESKFSSQVLLATTCIDNGISLKMNDLKHIIINIANPVTVKQALGRKRFIDTKDKINLYIKNWHNDELQGIINQKKKLYEMIDFWFKNGKNKFIEKYQIEEYDTMLFYTEIINGQEITKINQCYAFNLLYQKEYTSKILEQNVSSNLKYLNYICDYLDIPFNNFISLEDRHDFELLKTFILQYNNQKLYKDFPEYNQLKNIFTNQLLSYKEKTFGKLNVERFIQLLNLMQNDYSFSFISKTETSGQYRKKQYWILTCEELHSNDSTSTLPNSA